MGSSWAILGLLGSVAILAQVLSALAPPRKGLLFRFVGGFRAASANFSRLLSADPFTCERIFPSESSDGWRARARFRARCSRRPNCWRCHCCYPCFSSTRRSIPSRSFGRGRAAHHEQAVIRWFRAHRGYTGGHRATGQGKGRAWARPGPQWHYVVKFPRPATSCLDAGGQRG